MTLTTQPLRIAGITAGAAGMYCGSCMNDNRLASQMIKRGHDFLLMPTYTPTRTDETNVSAPQVFMGGINMFMQHKWPWTRHVPAWLRWVLDRRWLLQFLSRFGSATDARDLGSLTETTLLGIDGSQTNEVNQIVDWLAEEFKPQLVHLPNLMFLGLVEPIKQRLGVPVVCSIQGEDLFLNDLQEPFKTRVMTLIRKKSARVDAFVAHSAFYRDAMSQLIDCASDRIHVVPLGINVGDFHLETTAKNDVLSIGYLARLCPEKGLDILVDAFNILVNERGRDVQLEVAGYLSEKDRAFLERQRAKIDEWGLQTRCAFHIDITRQQKIAFLQRQDVFSVPARYQEPKGIYVLEAMASGCPVVLPDHGAFPAMLEGRDTGLLVSAGSAQALADGIDQLLADDRLRNRMGQNGVDTVETYYSQGHMALCYEQVYRSLVTSSVAAGTS